MFRPLGIRSARRTVAVALALAASALACLPGVAFAARPIVYVVVLDGLDGDRVHPGNAPFISSLLAGSGARSTFYPESRSVMIAETNPNHAAMVTGAYTDRSGIPGNAFALYAPLRSDSTCVATGPVDETRRPTPTSGENSSCIQAQTVFEAIKRQGNPDGLRTAAIFGKPKLGRIFATKRFDSRTRDADHVWAPCASGADDDDYCGDVSTNPVTGYTLEDSLVMDEVVRTVEQGVGPGAVKRRPDFTFVNLPQIDSAGHLTGQDLFAYDITIGQADEQIQRLVTLLRSRGEWSRTALVLLSDHSMDTTFERTTLTSVLAGSGVPEKDFVVVENGNLDGVYLSDRRSPKRFDVLKRLRAAALANPAVVEALYREPNPADGGRAHTIDGVHPAWHAAGPRSGDLIVIHRPGGTFTEPFPLSNPYLGNHGAPHTRDNFFAVIGGGPFVRQQRVPATATSVRDDTAANAGQAENVDPAATAMGLLGLAAPHDNAGRFLNEAFERARVPGSTRPSGRPRLAVRRLSATRTRARTARGCRSVRRRAVSVRVSLAPKVGRFDLEVRGKGRRRLLRNSARTTARFAARPGRRYSFRARKRAASGVAGDWRTRTLRPRATRCSIR